MCGILAVVLVAQVASAQEGNFGKNKVQYKNFTWYFIQTRHFDIYFSDGGEYLANFTAAAAESAYTMISRSFRYHINNRIPIMVSTIRTTNFSRRMSSANIWKKGSAA